MFSDSMMLGGGRKAAFSIANSVRLDGVADYFTRTPTLAGNTQVWTYSGWLKVGVESGGLFLLTAGDFSGGQTGAVDKIWINDSPTEKWLEVASFPGGASGYDWRVRTSALFRDPTAWYHVVVALNTHGATAEDRVRIWVNGQLQTSLALADYPDQHKTTLINSTQFPQYINKYCQLDVALYTAAGYFSETILVDGAALDPSHFGETDPVTGSWRPKRYVGPGNLPVYGADVTAGKTVSVSPDLVIDGTNLAPFAIDDNPSTKIATNNAFTANTSRIIIDLGAGGDKVIARITTNQESNYVWTAGKLQYSDDGTSWSDAGSFNPGNSTSTQAFDFPDGGAHRYWALMPTANAYGGSGYGLRFNEIELIERLDSASSFGTNGFHLDFADAGGSGGTVNTTFAGGFGACQVVINPARPLPNKAWITQIGVTQNSAESGKSVYIVRDDGGNGYTVMWVSAPFNHAGSGLQQVAVNYLVPETGTYLMAVDCPGWGLAWGHDADLIGTPYRYSLTTRSLGESFVAEIAADVTVYEAPPALTWTDGSLGRSVSGSNHWLPVSLGAADVVADTPTNNYAVWNVVEPGRAIFSNGGLTVTSNSPDYWHAVGSMGVSSGKWYFEVTPIAGSGWRVVGVSSTQVVSTSPPFNGAGNYGYVSHLGSTRNNGVTSPYGDSYASGDVIGVALDLDNGKLWFAKNNTWQASGDPVAGANAAFTGLAGTFFPCLGDDASGGVQGFTANFGQHPFAYSPPVGFKSLCTANLPKPVIQAPAKRMDVVTYTGNGTARAISGLGFQPDLVWVKCRSGGSASHTLFDVIRGPGKILSSAWSGAELTEYPDTLTSFNPDGFGLGIDVTAGTINVTGQTYVAWCWKAGGAAVANATGSIPSTVSANPTAGFSIAKYVGTSIAGTSFGHGLSAAPKFILVKNISSGNRNANTMDWMVFHAALGDSSQMRLNTTEGKLGPDAGMWNSTAPSTSVVTLGNHERVNYLGDSYIAYCWAEVPGFSTFGSYTGNGSSDGPFVHCGFRPRWIMRKCVTSAYDWDIYDCEREAWNDNAFARLTANTANAEDTANSGSAGSGLDVLSNGFKCRGDHVSFNGSGQTYIYAAFAEAPLGGAKTVPAKAR